MHCKSISYIAALLLLPLSCSKDRGEDTAGRVPVELGVQTAVVQSKAAAVESMQEGIQFGLLALDPSRGPWDTEATVLIPSSPAQVSGGAVKFLDWDGSEKSYWYPSVIDANYTFYAFMHEDMDLGTNPEAFEAVNNGDTFRVSNIDVWNNDVVWAKGEAEPLPDPTQSGVTWPGFNAGYALMAKTWGVSAQYKPILKFKHISCALRFAFVATSPEAQTQMSGIVSLTNLTLKGVYTHAWLDVLDGTLYPEGEPLEEIEITGNDTAPTFNDGEGAVFGDGPVYIVPSQEGLKLDFRINVGGAGYKPVRPVDVGTSAGFVAGHEYLFKIKVASASDIKLELLDETALRESITFEEAEMTEDGGGNVEIGGTI